MKICRIAAKGLKSKFNYLLTQAKKQTNKNTPLTKIPSNLELKDRSQPIQANER